MRPRVGGELRSQRAGLLKRYPLLDRGAVRRTEGDPPEVWMCRDDEYKATR